MRKVLSPNDDSKNVTDDIIKHVDFNYDDKQRHVQIHPFIANAMYHRDKSVLENERLKTLVTLARTLDDENLSKVIESLGYRISIEEKK